MCFIVNCYSKFKANLPLCVSLCIVIHSLCSYILHIIIISDHYFLAIVSAIFIILDIPIMSTASDLSKIKGITLGSLNVRSLYNKVDDVKLLLERTSLDILCIQETFLSTCIDDMHIHIPNYNISRLDRD